MVTYFLIKVPLNDTHLENLKEKLTLLNVQFKRIMSYFAIPLITIMTINIVAIIGSSCFMMLNQGNQKQYFVSMLFTFGIFAFLRLVGICAVGNIITNEYRELCRELHENIDEWTVDGFLCFIEIERLRPQFAVTLLDTFSLKQSTILTCLGMVLNYIVVLLQTESYDHLAMANVTLINVSTFDANDN